MKPKLYAIWSTFPCWTIVLGLFFSHHFARAQGDNQKPGNNQGAPYISNYPPDLYGAHNQNWAIVQDARGMMYFGNNHGILEYDGVSWQLIRLSNNDIARSLAIAGDGRIYVGGLGEIGYLAPGTTGKLYFVSLLAQVEKAYRDFADVWYTVAVGNHIYFVTHKYIFRWDGSRMYVWKASVSFHTAFAVNARFFVRQREVGLMEITGDSLRMAPLGESFATERISAMMPYPAGHSNRFLLATRSNGLLLYDGKTIERFATSADQIFTQGQIYAAALLADGRYAFGTLQEGVIIMDNKGKTHLRINKNAGLQDDNIWFLYQDRQGGLWMGMHHGISRAEIYSPTTQFTEREGIEGSVLELVRHKGRLYAATSMGVYYLDESPGAGRFHRVSGVSPQAWALLPFDDALLAGVFDGVYEIRAGQGRSINNAYAMSLHRSKQDPNRVFVGLQEGLKSIYYDGGQWRDEGRIQGIDQEIRSIYETSDGKLWLNTLHNGIVLVDLSKGYSLQAPVMRFDTLHGLPGNSRNFAFLSSRGMRFGTERGVYFFDEKKSRFFPDTGLIRGLPTAESILFSINQDRRGNLWMVAAEKSRSGVALLQPDGLYHWQAQPFLRITGLNTYYAYPDPALDRITWLGCIDRAIRYDETVAFNYSQDFKTLVRQVQANRDSLVYGGMAIPGAGMLKLAYAYNSLRFNYAAPSFDDESKTEYQYMLEGYDKVWSHWTKETYKDYTGLPPGIYRFRVRAQNIYRHPGEEDVFEFRILPPFYRTWWAFCIYAILLAGAVYLLRKNEMKKIREKHARQLEQVEYEKLQELDQLKSRFFADISHEFRTPLTLILGPVESLLAGKPAVETARQYQLIRRNAQRLLRLINQLLELSKLEAGKMKLDLNYADIIPLIKGLAYAFESALESKQVSLHFDTALERALLPFDRDKMEQIITNLISNAVKFTPPFGEVHVAVKQAGDQLQIEITDTGPGIPPEHLHRVFDRFYQAAETAPGGELGSGIGLALTKELVELHGGHINASNVKGKGARFSVLLPLPKEGPHPVTANTEFDSRPVILSEEAFLAPFLTMVEDGPDGENTLDLDNTLLLVEDNADMRAFIRDTLAGRYRIIEAADGQEGAEKALEHIPDIIISDVMMPRMDGLQLCDKLKNDERTSHIPVILLTAKADVESRIAGLERGADDYLSKPFHRDELLIRTRNLLDGRRRLRERYTSPQPPDPVQDKNLQIEDAFLLKVRGIVEEHLSETEFEIDQLARVLGMSRSQLFRKVKALTGQSPSIFIRNVRLHRGRELLLTTEMNVTEVAYEVGFSTPGYFSDAFMEAFGVRPSQVKN